MPAAAAWVSVGELREAEGLWVLGPLEFRAMRMCGGFILPSSKVLSPQSALFAYAAAVGKRVLAFMCDSSGMAL